MSDYIKEAVDDGFNGAVSDNMLGKKMGNTVELAGITAESEDLDITIDSLNRKIKTYRVLSILLWLLTGVVFIARFCMGGAV
jgi:hypothetical protein